MKDEDAEAVAAEIREGRDAIVVPQELVIDRTQGQPAKNLPAQISGMKMGERLKLALKGNRDARTILSRDSSQLVQRFVLQNPRITDEEVIAVAKNRSADHELLEIIYKKKEWVANYQIRLALVSNPKTPIVTAMRLVRTLLQRDLRQLARSKNVPSAVNGVAKRLVIESGR